MKTRTQILIVVLALAFVSMGAHFETSPETAKQSPEPADHPDIVGPLKDYKKSMEGHFKLENISKRLRTMLGARNFKNYLANE